VGGGEHDEERGANLAADLASDCPQRSGAPPEVALASTWRGLLSVRGTAPHFAALPQSTALLHPCPSLQSPVSPWLGVSITTPYAGEDHGLDSRADRPARARAILEFTLPTGEALFGTPRKAVGLLLELIKTSIIVVPLFVYDCLRGPAFCGMMFHGSGISTFSPQIAAGHNLGAKSVLAATTLGVSRASSVLVLVLYGTNTT
jgi:hypothetical protein